MGQVLPASAGVSSLQLVRVVQMTDTHKRLTEAELTVIEALARRDEPTAVALRSHVILQLVEGCRDAIRREATALALAEIVDREKTRSERLEAVCRRILANRAKDHVECERAIRELGEIVR